jgi:HlyD family secretion protein
VLFRIAADLSRMQVQVDVDESDIGGIAVGEAAAFQVESYPGQTFAGTVSSVRLQPVVETATPTATGSAAAIATASASAPSTVVSYTTIVDVSNPQERLRPGMTAEVRLPGARRDHAVRVPNSALSFHPSPDVLIAMGETSPSSGLSTARPHAVDTQEREVWQYDGRRFTPLIVHVGLSNDEWTELVSGPLHVGDAVVTNAAVSTR